MLHLILNHTATNLRSASEMQIDIDLSHKI